MFLATAPPAEGRFVRIRITQTPETQDIPLMTSRGAFCCANAFQFIDNLSDDEKIRYRGTCLRHGFASLAVIPVRYRETILGAIHLADARANIIPLERVEFLEHIAMMIGEAVHRFDIEANLRDSEERYRDLVESSPEAICMIVDEAVVYVNPMAVKLMRAESTDAMIGRTMWEFIHPDSRDIAINSLNEISVDSRQVGPVEIKAICLDGSVFDAGGRDRRCARRARGILAMFRDITEQTPAAGPAIENSVFWKPGWGIWATGMASSPMRCGGRMRCIASSGCRCSSSRPLMADTSILMTEIASSRP